MCMLSGMLASNLSLWGPLFRTRFGPLFRCFTPALRGRWSFLGVQKKSHPYGSGFFKASFGSIWFCLFRTLFWITFRTLWNIFWATRCNIMHQICGVGNKRGRQFQIKLLFVSLLLKSAWGRILLGGLRILSLFSKIKNAMATEHVPELRHDKLVLPWQSLFTEWSFGSLFGWLVGVPRWVGGRTGRQEMSLMRCARRSA